MGNSFWTATTSSSSYMIRFSAAGETTDKRPRHPEPEWTSNSQTYPAQQPNKQAEVVAPICGPQPYHSNETTQTQKTIDKTKCHSPGKQQEHWGKQHQSHGLSCCDCQDRHASATMISSPLWDNRHSRSAWCSQSASCFSFIHLLLSSLSASFSFAFRFLRCRVLNGTPMGSTSGASQAQSRAAQTMFLKFLRRSRKSVCGIAEPRSSGPMWVPQRAMLKSRRSGSGQ